ncbi:MAG: DM13 domain-containing protein [Anaerolineae bacterium]|nr:DM13 domain-containing protein [Anaerolineae bacterium]
MRLRLSLMLLGAALVAATFTFPLWQPMFDNRVAAPTEAFPGLAANLQDAFLSLPQEQQRAYLAFDQTDHSRALAMVIAALAPRTTLPDDEQAMPEMVSPVTVASGTFQPINAVRWGQGTVTIYEDASNAQTMRFEGYSMLGGPDLHVYLSPADAPNSFADMTVAGVEPEDIGSLKASDGSQNYTLPADIDLSLYRTVVVYSTSLDLIYTYAPLFVRQ